MPQLALFSCLLALAFISASPFPQTVGADPLILNTPESLIECEPVLLTWTGGEPPYELVVNPGTDGTTLQEIGFTNETSLTWVVGLAPGIVARFALRDGNLAIAAVQQTVSAGNDSSCLTSN